MTDLAGSVPAGYVIRLRREDDDGLLVRIENRAAQLFRAYGYPHIADHPIGSIAELRAMIGTSGVWVAATLRNDPAGFAVAGRLGDHFHLRELSVDPDHGRKGVGTALVAAVVAEARRVGAAGISLTTFRAVPFNKPFYERLGFRMVATEHAPDLLVQAFGAELPPGIDPGERVLMMRATD
jgi:GNAT superfamily N-acetyltransferase